jgi:uncharacterized protein (TIGR02594 family)
MTKTPLFRDSTGWAVKSLRQAIGAWSGVCLADNEVFDADLEALVRDFRSTHRLGGGSRWAFDATCGSPLRWANSSCFSALTPLWFDVAMCEIGEKEGSGKASNNPRILEYLQMFSHLNRSGLSAVDETAWCGAFVAWCLREAGATSNDFVNGRYLAGAKMWLHVGQKLKQPQVGCVTVVSRPAGSDTTGTTTSGYHVGFFVEATKGGVVLLGGNQGNKVSVAPFLRSKGWTVEGHRWPSGLALAPKKKK